MVTKVFGKNKTKNTHIIEGKSRVRKNSISRGKDSILSIQHSVFLRIFSISLYLGYPKIKATVLKFPTSKTLPLPILVHITKLGNSRKHTVRSIYVPADKCTSEQNSWGFGIEIRQTTNDVTLRVMTRY